MRANREGERESGKERGGKRDYYEKRETTMTYHTANHPTSFHPSSYGRMGGDQSIVRLRAYSTLPRMRNDRR